MASVFPTDQDKLTIVDLTTLRTWTGLNDETWAAISLSLGTIPNCRVLAKEPVEMVRHVLRNVWVPTPTIGTAGGAADRELTPVEAVVFGHTWRVSRNMLGMPEEDPSLSWCYLGWFGRGRRRVLLSRPRPQGEPSGLSQASSTKVIETEIVDLTSGELAQFFANHVEITGAEPLAECKPSKNQVFTNLESPYADFSVLTPYGRTMQKRMRLRSWIPQGDGTYRPIEVLGPPDFSAWHACWRVYKSIMLMLRTPVIQGPPPSYGCIFCSFGGVYGEYSRTCSRTS